MTRMTGPDCVVMCNLINTYIHTTESRLSFTENILCVGFHHLKVRCKMENTIPNVRATVTVFYSGVFICLNRIEREILSVLGLSIMRLLPFS